MLDIAPHPRTTRVFVGSCVLSASGAPRVMSASVPLRPLGLGLLAGLAGLLAGCSSAYPTDLSYPPRADWIVEERPGDQPDHLDQPGQLDISLAALADPK